MPSRWNSIRRRAASREPRPRTPRIALRNNKEGWVRLDFMVDTNGDPYEIVVTESVGDDVFHDAAIRALEKSRFEPARFEGTPLDAGHHLYYHFEMDSSGARAWFVRVYRAVMRAISDGDREKADGLFEELDSSGPLNLYEDAFLHIAKSGYHASWGNEQQQLKALDTRSHGNTFLATSNSSAIREQPSG